MYTKEEREAKTNQLIEAVKAMNTEQLIALNKLIDKLEENYQRKQAAEGGA